MAWREVSPEAMWGVGRAGHICDSFRPAPRRLEEREPEMEHPERRGHCDGELGEGCPLLHLMREVTENQGPTGLWDRSHRWL